MMVMMMMMVLMQIVRARHFARVRIGHEVSNAPGHLSDPFSVRVVTVVVVISSRTRLFTQ